MRKLILKMETTLDGYVEGKNGDMSWMQFDDDATWAELFDMLNDKVDLFLLGRNMWHGYRDYWRKALAEPDKFSKHEVEYAKLAEKTPHIVFSKTLKESGWENTTINSGDLEAEIKKIKASDGKDIQIVGGAEFAASMLDTGLVDEYRILVNPAIIGGGKSFFHQIKNRHSLQLTEVKQLNGRVVALVYKQLDTDKK
nr:dihydrofolate reductase family protein [uncultured Mucilaginibacter sp.]